MEFFWVFLRSRLLLLLKLRPFSFYLQNVLSILLVDLHEHSPQLDPFVEVLKDLDFDPLDFLSLLHSAAVAHVPLLLEVGVPRVDGRLGTLFPLPLPLQLQLQFLDFGPQVGDDVLVLADVDGDQLFVGDLPGFDVLGPVGVFQTVDGLLELAAGRRYAGDHRGFAVAPQTVLQQPSQLAVPVRNEEALLILVS